MPLFFRNKRLIVLLVSIIVLVALIGFSLRERESLTWPEKFANDMIGIGQVVIAKPAHYIAGFFETLEEIKNTYEENEKLKIRLEELAKLETLVSELTKENEELREIIGMKESLRDYEVIHGTVIASNPDQWNKYIKINKGEVDGVKKDMAVITSKGLIGKVRSTNKFTSTIELLSMNNSKSRISALIQGKENVYGLIEGYDEESEMLLMKRIPFDVEIKEGQKVVTSGLGGVFPRLLPIGEVAKVEPDQYGLNQTAYVKPAADLNDIVYVMVVKRSITEVQLEDESEDQAE
ncbi:rod shape-determining protein MreC [Aeribacillus pallidus]|jgi:rod shape-determining protein MreC|uniref:rod shape-determining protein MreC n=1 Tax=Aeribacillus pallidus TaxID=33936 RepID=UPI003D223A21